MKTQTAFAIYSGKTLLPFSIRSTRKQALEDYLLCRTFDRDGMKHRNLSVQKVNVTPVKPIA